jgi:hypothetical protein
MRDHNAKRLFWIWYSTLLLVTFVVLAIVVDQAHAEVAPSVPINALRTTALWDICTTKTSTIRAVSETTKQLAYLRDGTPFGNHTGRCSGFRGCEVDHIVSLELGGSNDLSNLKIQPYTGSCNAVDKDKLENRLHRMVCNGQLTVDYAQDLIYTNWIAGYKLYINNLGCVR